MSRSENATSAMLAGRAEKFGGLGAGVAIRHRRDTLRHQLWMRRTDKWDGFAFVPLVDAEIFAIHCDDAVVGVKLVHAGDAEVGQIGVAIAIAAREGGEWPSIRP